MAHGMSGPKGRFASRIIMVDGTGEKDTVDYMVEMAGSFCQQIALKLQTQRSALTPWAFFRGPSLLGMESATASALVQRELNAAEGEDVFLIGYSRGGAIVIDAASKYRGTIKAMFLFDAVDRSFVVDGNKIPSNVLKVYHARRLPTWHLDVEIDLNSTKAKNYEQDARSLAFSGQFKELSQHVTEVGGAIKRTKEKPHLTRNVLPFVANGFGNCGLQYQDASLKDRYEEKFFRGSHGAIGGVPWPESRVRGDKLAVRAVRTWMWKHLASEGVL